MNDALALLELDSVALGLRTIDLMVKRAEVKVLEANLVEPGKFLILYSGPVAETQESRDAAVEFTGASLLNEMLIPHVHPDLLQGLYGNEEHLSGDEYDCLGVVETRMVCGALLACDRALKDADVRLAGIRLTGGLAGRAYFVIYGTQHDVDEGIAVSVKAAEAFRGVHRTELISRPHDDMVRWVLRPHPFTIKQ